jgi:hypothetical protein
MRLNLCWYRFGFAVGAMLIALPVTSQTTAKSQPWLFRSNAQVEIVPC